MSIAAMVHVWKHSKQRGSKLLMLLAIADQANEDGYCWPSVRALAEKVRMEVRNAQVLIRELEESGELVVRTEEGKRVKNGWTNRYEINFDVPLPGVHHSAPLQESAPVGVQASAPVGVHHSAPNPKEEPKEEPTVLKITSIPCQGGSVNLRPPFAESVEFVQALKAWIAYTETTAKPCGIVYLEGLMMMFGRHTVIGCTKALEEALLSKWRSIQEATVTKHDRQQTGDLASLIGVGP